MTGIHYIVQFSILCVLLCSTVLFAQDVKIVPQCFPMIVLKKDDFSEPVSSVEKVRSLGVQLEAYLCNNNLPYSETNLYSQEFLLGDGSTISIYYYIFNSRHEAAHAILYWISNTASIAHPVLKKKSRLGLPENSVAYEYKSRISSDAILFHYDNLFVGIFIRSPNNQHKYPCDEFARKIIKRAQQFQADKTHEIQNVKIDKRCLPMIALKKDDFNRPILSTKENVSGIETLLRGYLRSNKLPYSKTNHYHQEFLLEDDISISVTYYIFNSRDDADDAILYWISSTDRVRAKPVLENNWHVQKRKSRLGLPEDSVAYEYEHEPSDNLYGVLFQYDNLFVNISIRPCDDYERLKYPCDEFVRKIIQRVQQFQADKTLENQNVNNEEVRHHSSSAVLLIKCRRNISQYICNFVPFIRGNKDEI